ncbi:coiled-coil domain-containing protein 127-like [Hemiscyllium ocellatum]|uniref:coiled-coil domain-containing protein 127-like n=1 Tax=Hemiscyllium ocellatum TaxID=170820 RepID=UPI002967590B|nr:coiled-coil domain-containing protein 127-like [Hemiscyllium ocellatum]XP_060678835.1 coiled-coil domain-containing protein 127-like [Hemiscyllium ocellatum]XP_060678836.1 coiled-coil domain-containing protein 127-like [Hemiscyllium ocellatum]
MNNLNVPEQQWNIFPNHRDGGGDGSKWNYALLVPMLGLAAFRWIWSRESQKEIKQVRAECKNIINATQQDLKLKYEDTIVQNRRLLAYCELEQEKLKSKVQSYREALLAQSRQLVEERKQLEEERVNLEQKKNFLQYSGAAGALYHDMMEREAVWQSKATALIKEFENSLVHRQSLFCSYFKPRQERLDLERKILNQAVRNPIARELDIETGLNDIFKYETHCANVQNTDKRQNGRLMWVYLAYWELQANLQKFKKVEAALLTKQAD